MFKGQTKLTSQKGIAKDLKKAMVKNRFDENSGIPNDELNVSEEWSSNIH